MAIGGASFVLELRDDWAGRVVNSVSAGWYLERTVASDVAAPLLSVETVASCPPVPANLPSYPVPAGTCHTDDRTWYLEVAGSLVVIDAPGDIAVQAFVHRETPADAPELVRLLTYAVSAALRRSDRFELHSAALTDPGGRSVLIAGPSGSGKSTLSVHLASAGWAYLTDDVLVLERQSAGMTAWPLRRAFAVTGATVAASPALRAGGAMADAFEQGAKRLFDPDAIFEHAAASCRPSALLFPELTHHPVSEVEAIPASAALTRLLRLSPWACYDRATAPRHIAALSALASQAPAHVVRAGTDMLDQHAAATLVARCLTT